MKTSRTLNTVIVLVAPLMLAGCTPAPSEQERNMTPTQSKEALAELMTSTRHVMDLGEESWDPEYELVAGPCTMSNGETGANYIEARTWTGDTDRDALVSTVQEYWESLGLTTTIDDRSDPGDTLVFLTGRGGPVKNIRIVIIPGQVGLDGESICVVGDPRELVRHLN